MHFQRHVHIAQETLNDLIDDAQAGLCDQECSELEIDCSQVTLVSTFAIDRLIRLNLSARRFGKSVVLTNPSDIVVEVIELTRLDRMVTFRYDEAHEFPPRPRFTS